MRQRVHSEWLEKVVEAAEARVARGLPDGLAYVLFIHDPKTGLTQPAFNIRPDAVARFCLEAAEAIVAGMPRSEARRDG